MGRLSKARIRNKRPDKTYYIYCEGLTECNYFDALKKDIVQIIRVKNIDIKSFHKGCNTLSLVEKAEEELSKISDYSQNDDEVWIVFDKDDFPNDNFDNAIKSAESKGFKAAYSNECFEVWFLLHFSYFNKTDSRDKYFEILLANLKKLDSSIRIESYRRDGKTLNRIYSLLRPSLDQAIANSERLIRSYEHDTLKNTPAKQKPSTTVHLLVSELNKLMRI